MKVVSVNISEEKGVIKKPVHSINITPTGIEGDAHASNWHRQISLLGVESIQKFSESAGKLFSFGEFAENITTQGISLIKCAPFDRFFIGNCELEVTQIGKKCHGAGCAIYKEVGKCVMPKEGIFCRVIKPGIIKSEDPIQYVPKVMRVLIITLSDRAYSGEYKDRSGPIIAERTKIFFSLKGWKSEITTKVIPDDASELKQIFNESRNKYDLIYTTGGTGIGARDITVDVVKTYLKSEIPGIMDYIRVTAGAKNPNALISRSIAGIYDKTPTFTLPGSVKAVNEYLDTIETVLLHLFFMIEEIDHH